MTKTYNPVTAECIDELRKALGEKYVTADPEKLDVYKTDEEANPKYHHLPEVIVFPGSTEEVAAVVKIANRFLTPVTPRGAGTGLAGGAIPVFGGIVLVVDRMDQILEFNETSMYAVAQAGVRTDIIQKEAKKRGLLYAGDPCSSDSCVIGGNVATNAGGNKAVKYGSTRDQIFGVKIVTPRGDIVDLGGRLVKKSTGYALEQLFIGSEGTLGIVTEVTLKLKPLPPENMDILAIFDDLDKALTLPGKVVKAGIAPTSLEFMDNNAIRSCGRYIKMDLPHADKNGVYVIVSVEGFTEEEIDKQAEMLDQLCEECGAVEILVADDRIWAARRGLAEAARADSLVYYAEDVVVPVDSIAEVIKRLPALEAKHGVATTTGGHIGDGNIHVNVLKMDIPDDVWDAKLDAFHLDLYSLVYSLGGRLSGEHGIGSKKIGEMEHFTNPIELQMMKDIKNALDPNGILNPGKIFHL